MNYEQMSDFEINKAVAQRFYSGMSVEFHQIQSMVEVCDCTGEIGTFDYCNNPADAWPVIAENKISIIWDADYKTYHVGAQFNNLAGCEGGGYDFRGRSVRVKETPLRAGFYKR